MGRELTGEEVRDPSSKVVDLDLHPFMPDIAERAGTTDDTVSILVDEHEPSKVVKIGSHLGLKMRGPLVEFSKANLDVVAWSHSDMVWNDPK